MKYKDYFQEYWSLSSLQFSVAIALDFLNEDIAATAVLTFLGTNTVDNATNQQNMIQLRMELEQKLLMHEDSLLIEFLNYLFRKKVLKTNKRLIGNGDSDKISRVHANADLFTLKELLQTVSVNAVYEKTMDILFTHEPNKLIHLYMGTGMYKCFFVNKIKHKYSYSADGMRRNVLSASIIMEVLENFSSWVRQYSANGTYNPDTGTPIPFLEKSFEFYSKGDKTKNIFRYLNQRGQDRDIGDDGKTTMLDLVGIDTNQENVPFNFVAICTKINRASCLLFRHGTNAYAFYDIFSYHCDKITEEVYKNSKKQLSMLKGINFFYNSDTTYTIEGCTTSIRTKLNSRLRLCDIFEPLISRGIRKEDIYSLYRRVLNETNNTSKKDGARLFSVDGYNTRHAESNGQMLQIIIDGYLALREFLHYFNGKKDRSENALKEFPVDIFRNRSYLRRFKTMERYLSDIKEVRQLVNEVEHDFSRSADSVNGHLSNDKIYSILAKSKAIMGNPLVNELGELPLSYIIDAVNQNSKLDKDECLHNLVYQLSGSWEALCVEADGRNWSLEGLQSKSYVDSISLLHSLMKAILSLDDEKIYSASAVRYYLGFVNCLQHTMGLEAHPVMDCNSNYILKEDSILDEMQYLAEFAEDGNEKSIEFYKQSFILRVKCIHVVIAAFLGVPIDKTYHGSWQDLRNLFCMAEILELYIDYASKFFTTLKMETSDNYLVLAQAAAESSFLETVLTISDCSALSFLYGSMRELGYKLKSGMDHRALVCNVERNKQLVRSLNELLKKVKNHLETCELLKDCISSTLNTKSFCYAVDIQTEKVLRKAAASLMEQILPTLEQSKSGILRRKLEANFNFDSLGYVILGGVRYCKDGRKYVHCDGYVVDVIQGLEEFTIERMSEEFMEMLLQESILGGY